MSKTLEFEADLRKELPRFYETIREFNEIIQTESKQLATLDDWMDSSVDQLFVETATWNLKRWENIFGIPVDESKPIDQRRSVIKSKIRGAGVTTTELVKNVAESWYNGEIEVTEEILKIIIKFNSNYGVPSNLEDVERALREIIPAHLIVEFLFSYLLIRDIHGVMTLTELETQTLDKFAGGGNVG